MRGKYITTNIRLAVLAGSKKINANEVKETMASLHNLKPIWTKTAVATQKENKQVVEYMAEAV